MRINRYIARSGIASRRKAENFITAGNVTVNGKVTTDLATNVEVGDEVLVNGEKISLPKLSYIAFNKPAGYATTKSDPHESHTIFELLPNDNSLFAVGRLDRNTSGLIIITNDGDFAQNLIHPTKKIEKEYLIRTSYPITDGQLAALTKGVELDDGPAKTKIVKLVSEKELIMVIEMGRKRVVRRMIKSVGNKVTGLARIRIGDIKIGNLPVGKYRDLTPEEVSKYV